MTHKVFVERNREELPRTTELVTECPRCSTRMEVRYEEPFCPDCGFVDYSYVAPVAPTRGTFLGSATRFLVRYSGVTEKFRSKIITVRVIYLGPVG